MSGVEVLVASLLITASIIGAYHLGCAVGAERDRSVDR